jgi:hypothetical protein
MYRHISFTMMEGFGLVDLLDSFVTICRSMYSRTSIIRASINRASHRYGSSPLSVRGRTCERTAVRISTPEKKMLSERVNKRKHVVLNNVF